MICQLDNKNTIKNINDSKARLGDTYIFQPTPILLYYYELTLNDIIEFTSVSNICNIKFSFQFNLTKIVNGLPSTKKIKNSKWPQIIFFCQNGLKY